MTKEEILRHLEIDRETALDVGWTREELAEMLNIRTAQAKSRIRDGMDSGKIESAGIGRRFDRNGRLIPKPIYRFANVQTSKNTPKTTQKRNHRAKVGA